MGTIETRKAARFLHIGTYGGKFLALPLSNGAAVKLAARGIVYDCGCGHDLHLTPDHKWDVDDVQALLIAATEVRAWRRRHSTSRWQDEPFAEDDDGWDTESGRVGKTLFANAIQVWSAFQDRKCSVAEAAKTFNCAPQKIVDAVEDHAWMFVFGGGEREHHDDFSKLFIEHEGE